MSGVYTKEQILKMSDEEIEELVSEPDWVIDGDKVRKASEEELKKADKYWKKRGTGSIDGETI